MARFYNPTDGGGSASANIADFIFINEDEDFSKMTLPINKEMTIETTRDDDGDADINIESADDVFIRAYGDDIGLSAFNEVNISTNDENYQWTFANSGCLSFPSAGQICNPPNSSGDAYGYSTISITPDANTSDDRYIIIDPTAPNHIHIRAGGMQDNSNAQLILGGERNAVSVSDSARWVEIKTAITANINTYENINSASGSTFIGSMPVIIDPGYKVYVDGVDHEVLSVVPNSPSIGQVEVFTHAANFVPGQMYTFRGDDGSNNSWAFTDTGYFYGPAEGGINVNGITNPSNSEHIYVTSNYKVYLNGTNGEFLNDPAVPSNQIATIGDVAAVATPYHGSFYSTQDQSIAADTPTAMTYNEEDFANGITIEDTSKITIANAGKYNIQFSAQLFHDGGGGEGDTVNIWLSKNGSPVTNSNTKVIVQSNYRYVVAAWNFFVDAAANDYYEIVWATDNASIDLVHEPSGDYPAIPSVILTVNQIG